MKQKSAETDDRFMTTVRLGPRGQLVIPKEARALYNVKPGDSLLLLADREGGISLQRMDRCRELFTSVFPDSKLK